MTPDEFEEWVIKTRHDQGLPTRVEDTDTLIQIVNMIRSSQRD